MKKVIKSDKPVTSLLLFWSHKCDFGAEPRSRIIATSVVKGLMTHSCEETVNGELLLCTFITHSCVLCVLIKDSESSVIFTFLSSWVKVGRRCACIQGKPLGDIYRHNRN
jgi:hypothetical protein